MSAHSKPDHNAAKSGAVRTILVVDDDEAAKLRFALDFGSLKLCLRAEIHHVSSIAEAIAFISRAIVHVILLDKNLGSENGIDAIPELVKLQPHLQIIMLTGSNEISDVVRATKLGAFDYVPKEMCAELLSVHVRRAIQVSELFLEKDRLKRRDHLVESNLGGESRAFQEVLNLAQLLAATNRPILLLGETGTGKSALARWINSCRAKFLSQYDRPFFAINVSTLSGNLIESELFGHEKGAFTGATETKQGLFELAHSGTLFLDEIGELPFEFQAKLLTVIEDGTFKRVGGKQMLRASPKLVLATNRDLTKMVEEGTFRKDLLMRINMFPIQMPSLNDRKEDIPEIVRALLPRSCRETGVFVSFDEIPTSFLVYLCSSPIEGNIRGVQNLLERLLVLSPRDLSGRPIMTMWSQISGFSTSEKQATAALDEANGSLSLQDLLERPTRVLGPGFPGLRKIKDMIERRILTEARERYSVDKDIAIALGISKSATSAHLSRMKLTDENTSPTQSQGGSRERGKKSS